MEDWVCVHDILARLSEELLECSRSCAVRREGVILRFLYTPTEPGFMWYLTKHSNTKRRQKVARK